MFSMRMLLNKKPRLESSLAELIVVAHLQAAENEGIIGHMDGKHK
jgi:hypothetical protein